MKGLVLLPISFALMGLIACSGDPHAGGFGSETQNTVSGIVYNDQGPVVNARLVVRNLEDTDSVQVFTDSSGVWNAELSMGYWLAQTQMDDQSAQTLVKVVDKSVQSQDLHLLPFVSVEGVNPDWAGAKMALRGLGRSTTVSNEGYWSFSQVPQGAYLAEVKSFTAIVGDDRYIGAHVLDSDTLLLEDFEDSLGANDLHGIIGEGWWLVWRNDAMGSSMEPSTWPQDYKSSLIYDSVFAGSQSMRLVLRPAMGDTIQIVMPIGGKWNPNDLDPVWHYFGNWRSLRFAAKGSGRVQLSVFGRTPPPERAEELFVVEFDLQEQWTEHVFSPQQFLSTHNNGHNLVGREIRHIAWNVQDTSILNLDHIRIEGANVADLLLNTRR